MKVSLRWILDLVPGLDRSADELADALALRGAPVESIERGGEGLGDIVVGKVLTAEKHPNADRLSLCTVDGGRGVVSVVCGAPNVRAGGWYPFAPVGAVLPGDFQIKKAKIRGEVSEGMLCSRKELGLGEDHSGILELTGDFEPGESFVHAFGLADSTLDVEVTANRGDLLSHVGVAREAAADAGLVLTLGPIPDDPGVDLSYEEGAPEVSVGAVTVRIEDSELCPRYLGAVIRGVKVGPSPKWLQDRLRGAGGRPINNVVDATNYVMLELGHPLHAFDLAHMAGSTVVVRRAAASEPTFTTLDGVERKVSSDMLMICDAEKPVGVAGVMGGLDSEVEDDTTDVLLECAIFEPKSIRATRKALAISTDASYRFERGVDPEGIRVALERCVGLILATAGGAVDGPVLDCGTQRYAPEPVALRLSRVERVLGVPFEAARVRELLEPLGFEIVGEAAGALEVRVPGFRSYDVTREVDLIEEIARSHGYDEFPTELAPYRPGTVPDHPLFALEDELRLSMASLGLFEAHTPAFAPEGEGDVEVANPLNAREPFLRSTLVPALLRRLERNLAHGNRDVRLFEIGTGFWRRGSGEPPREATLVAAVLTGRRNPPHWATPAEPIDLWDVKGLLEGVVGRVYPTGVSIVPAAEPSRRRDPAAGFDVIAADGDVVGMAGRVLPQAVDAPVWAGDVWALEVALPRTAPAREPVAYVPLPTQPAVERDLALRVPEGVEAARVEDSIRAAAGTLLESVDLFDVYVPEGGREDRRSLAFRLRFRSAERTLKDQEVDRAVDSVVGALEEELGVERRG